MLFINKDVETYSAIKREPKKGSVKKCLFFRHFIPSYKSFGLEYDVKTLDSSQFEIVCFSKFVMQK